MHLVVAYCRTCDLIFLGSAEPDNSLAVKLGSTVLPDVDKNFDPRMASGFPDPEANFLQQSELHAGQQSTFSSIPTMDKVRVSPAWRVSTYCPCCREILF